MALCPDLILLEAQPHGLAVLDGRIVAVGDDATLRALAGPATRRLSAGGRRVVPGFHDAHLHFQMLGHNLSAVDLFEVPSLAEAQHRLATRSAELPAGRWLTGRGWLQDLGPGGQFPTAADLDAAVPQRPAILRHKSGHAAWVNSAALRLADITAATPDPEGGVIGRDAAGQPDGMLYENACELVGRHVPAPTAADNLAAARAAQTHAHALGVTAVQCFDGRRSLLAFAALEAADQLRLRATAHLYPDQLDGLIAAGLRSGFGSAWLQLGYLKLFADGALGSVTAWMLEPYEGTPDQVGVATIGCEELREWTTRASRHGFPSAVHAIGDRACREVLDAFAALRRDEASWGLTPAERPHRIEHAQVLHSDDLPRLAALGVVASMQPIHATQDMLLVDRWWGARGAGAYAFRSLLDAGTALACGSDAPVEDLNPLLGLHAAVTRRRVGGQPGPQGWYPEQRLTLDEALAGFTHGAAAACGRGHELGRLEPGYLADWVVLSADPWQLDPQELPTVRVWQTVVGGEVVYQAE
ncbi:MAG: amidohydrolase [Fimbriimonadaceae bacterium]|nr:amidohydrolase [Fimbriimonadaceae bacterium]